MAGMPKWLIPLIVLAWVGGGVAMYYGQWLPVVVMVGMGILGVMVAGGALWANRQATRMVRRQVQQASGTAGTGETAEEAAARRRETAKRRQERNRKHRRK